MTRLGLGCNGHKKRENLTLKSRVLGPQVLDSILDLTWSQVPSSLLFWLMDLQVWKPVFAKW